MQGTGSRRTDKKEMEAYDSVASIDYYHAISAPVPSAISHLLATLCREGVRQMESGS